MNNRKFSLEIIALILSLTIFCFILPNIEKPQRYTILQPTRTPHIIHNTIRVTITKYIFFPQPEVIVELPSLTSALPIPTPIPTFTPTTTPTTTPTKIITEYFTNDDPICSLNIRTEPNLKGEIVGKIAQNWIVKAIEVVEGEEVMGSNLWCKIKANILYSKDVYVWCKALKPISKNSLE